MNSLLSIAVFSTLAAADVWVAPVHQRIFPDTQTPRGALREIEVSLARGEYESVQVVVRADRDGIDQLTVGTDPDPASPILGPDIREVAFLRTGPPTARAVSRRPLWPDPLVPVVERPLPPGESRVFWLTCSVRPDAAPGFHEMEIHVHTDGDKPRNVTIRFEVFDFLIPRTPSLGAHYTMNAAPVRNAYGWRDETLQQWQSMYDTLAGFRLSYAPATTFTANEFSSDHVSYLASTNAMRVIDSGLVVSPSGGESSNLNEAINVQNEWLRARGQSGQGVVTTRVPTLREHWTDMRSNLARIGETGSATRRVLIGPLHPWWQREVDVWAIPWASYSRSARELIDSQRSLAWEQGAPVLSARSSSALQPTLARDAYDGSLFTYWEPGFNDEAPSLQIELATPVKIAALRLAWMPQAIPDSVRLFSSRDGIDFTPATVSWTKQSDEGDFGYVWWEGTLRVEKTFAAFRLECERRVEADIQLAEISFESYPQYLPLPDEHRIEPWLSFDPKAFPSSAIDAPLLDYRIKPWICWAHDIDGFAGGLLTDWPLQLYPAASAIPQTWPPGPTEDFLIYPAPGAPVPSVRLMQLRDGMEDYEYLRALTTVLESVDTARDLSWLYELVAPAPGMVEGARRAPGETMADILRRRNEIGRALTAFASGKVPSDPWGFAR